MSDGYLGSFCPEHGFDVPVDEDGLCSGCGVVAFGDAVDALYRDRAKLRELVKEWRTIGLQLHQFTVYGVCADELDALLVLEVTP